MVSFWQAWLPLQSMMQVVPLQDEHSGGHIAAPGAALMVPQVRQ
jgi:hypothetical protein